MIFLRPANSSTTTKLLAKIFMKSSEEVTLRKIYSQQTDFFFLGKKIHKSMVTIRKRKIRFVIIEENRLLREL